MTRIGRLVLTAAVLALPLMAATPATAGGGCHSGGPTQGAGTTVELIRNCMSPTVLEVTEGADVTFVNKDGILHNVTSPSEYAEVSPGQSLVKRFDEEGTFLFACTLHPGMMGAVVVGDGETNEVTPIAAAPAARTSPTDSTPWTAVTAGALTLAAVASAGGYAVGRRRRAP